MRPLRNWLAAAPLLAASLASAAPPQVVPVANLAGAPKVDGDLADWGSGGWQQVPIKPALDKADRAKYGLDPAEDRNVTGSLTVQVKAGVAQGRLFLAVRYPDDREDRDYRGWEWRGDRYTEGKRLDDMASVRFHMGGDYDRTMLSAKEYQVDVWLWSAGRSDRSGVADDFQHSISTRMIEDAAEYNLPGGQTVYIKKVRDAGTPSTKAVPRPKENKGERVPSLEIQKPGGSAADVAARGVWKAGFWHLEFARALNTGNGDDLAFKPGQKVTAQLAVFNRANAENKSVSEPLLLDFSAVK
jgi:ethylbenzene dehydrogenase